MPTCYSINYRLAAVVRVCLHRRTHRSHLMVNLILLLCVRERSCHVAENLGDGPQAHTSTDPHMWRTAIDVQRHKEVIVKALSSILLLLHKHFKLNHVYQSECIAQHLVCFFAQVDGGVHLQVFANCIPLLLKFFDQNIHGYVMRNTDIEPLNFPAAQIFHAKSDCAFDFIISL